jgi:hypothetical protein
MARTSWYFSGRDRARRRALRGAGPRAGGSARVLRSQSVGHRRRAGRHGKDPPRVGARRARAWRRSCGLLRRARGGGRPDVDARAHRPRARDRRRLGARGLGFPPRTPRPGAARARRSRGAGRRLGGPRRGVGVAQHPRLGHVPSSSRWSGGTIVSARAARDRRRGGALRCTSPRRPGERGAGRSSGAWCRRRDRSHAPRDRARRVPARRPLVGGPRAAARGPVARLARARRGASRVDAPRGRRLPRARDRGRASPLRAARHAPGWLHARGRRGGAGGHPGSPRDARRDRGARSCLAPPRAWGGRPDAVRVLLDHS